VPISLEELMRRIQALIDDGYGASRVFVMDSHDGSKHAINAVTTRTEDAPSLTQTITQVMIYI